MPDSSPMQKTFGELTLDEFFDIVQLRTTVFFLEQRIDEEELDERDRDPSTLHVWISDDRGVASYLRVVTVDDADAVEDARMLIGRVVTRADRRGEGLSRRLLEIVLDRFGDEPLGLHSQTYVQPLYAAVGFTRIGEEYVEAGIPHVSMYRAPS